MGEGCEAWATAASWARSQRAGSRCAQGAAGRTRFSCVRVACRGRGPHVAVPQLQEHLAAAAVPAGSGAGERHFNGMPPWRRSATQCWAGALAAQRRPRATSAAAPRGASTQQRHRGAHHHAAAPGAPPAPPARPSRAPSPASRFLRAEAQDCTAARSSSAEWMLPWLGPRRASFTTAGRHEAGPGRRDQQLAWFAGKGAGRRRRRWGGHVCGSCMQQAH